MVLAVKVVYYIKLALRLLNRHTLEKKEGTSMKLKELLQGLHVISASADMDMEIGGVS